VFKTTASTKIESTARSTNVSISCFSAMEDDDYAAEEWYTYKPGHAGARKRKVGYSTNHPEGLKTATHVRIEASSVAPNAFLRNEMLVAVDLLSGLQEIEVRAFQYCTNLQFVFIPSTVRWIDALAFEACRSLTTISIPKSTSGIRHGAFSQCTALTTVTLPKDGILEALENDLFSYCSSLEAIHVPSSVKYIRESVFEGCQELVTIELPEGILTLGKRCFFDAEVLSNMVIPSTTECIEDDLFVGADEIRQAVRHPNGEEEGSEEDSEEEDDEDTNTNLANAMAKRFDGLPLHTMCFYHTYYPTIEKIITDIHSHSQDPDGVDMFGMTPLHVLAQSTEPKVGLFQALSKCVPPRMFMAKDKWGMTPIQCLMHSSMPGAEKSINYLIQHTVVDRSEWLGLARWKADILNQVNLLDLTHSLSNTRNQHDQIERLYSLLEKLELLESTSLVESALWKTRIGGSQSSSLPTRVDREVCRIHCGAGTVISNVLQFLLDSTDR
ncbi:MAG: hypothetical protein SGBAC_010014, partial [Bacillariaceae sp.]